MSNGRPAWVENDDIATKPVQVYGWNGGPVRLAVGADGYLVFRAYGTDGTNDVQLRCTSAGVLLTTPYFGPVYASDPSSGNYDGEMITNSTDNKVKIWYNGTWNTYLTLTGGTPPTLYALLMEDDSNFALEDDTILALES